ncbi:MAG TPA: class I SAM-dependent methyltransferase [Gemmatimonadales bacterium]|nr:class I SAM-dependent methyltransferase [Gemmatimonadales bacterium]
MDAAYAAVYAELNARHWWWRAREAFLLSRLRELLPPDGRRRILDVGCGDGLFLDRLAPWGRAEGIETDVATLSPAAAHRPIHLGPFDESYHPDAPFDLVLFLDVLEHLDRPDAALRRAAELLAPGGRVLVSVPAFPALWTRHDVLNHHRLRYTRGSLTALARGAGLRVEWSRYLFFSVALGKVAVRLAETIGAGRPRPPRVPPAPLNALARAVASVDLAVGRRIPLPLGSSLVAVLAPA